MNAVQKEQQKTKPSQVWAVALIVSVLVAIMIGVGNHHLRVDKRLTTVEEQLDKIQGKLKKMKPPSQEITTDLLGESQPGGAVHFANTGTWGSWSSTKLCPENYYVCGMQQKVERSQGRGGDDTAMNGVAFYCCPIKTPWEEKK